MCHSKKLYLLDDEWSDFIDKESGLGGMFVINNMVIVASNFVLAAYNNKGKNLWTNDDIRLAAMRGLRYHSTFGVCKTSNNFLVADEKFVYLASSIKVKKNEVIKDNITIFDIKKGKEISVVEMAENELIIDVQLWNNNLLLITTNGLKVVNKPA
jgi:outer membrane protein assembly factor BamB